MTEIDIIHNILNYKEKKSKAIEYQFYAQAAEARDEERFYESELYKLITKKTIVEDVSDNVTFKEIHNLLYDYFDNKFGVEYKKNCDGKFCSSIRRHIKLIELGI